jgi:hypothetical protein
MIIFQKNKALFTTSVFVELSESNPRIPVISKSIFGSSVLGQFYL